MKKFIFNTAWTIVYIALHISLTITTAAHYFGGQICMQIHRLYNEHYCSKHGRAEFPEFKEVHEGYHRSWEMRYHNGKEITIE
jgi:hypothetical protein